MDFVLVWFGSVLLGVKEGSRGFRVCLEFLVVFVFLEDLDKIIEEGDVLSVEGERKLLF